MANFNVLLCFVRYFVLRYFGICCRADNVNSIHLFAVIAVQSVLNKYRWLNSWQKRLCKSKIFPLSRFLFFLFLLPLELSITRTSFPSIFMNNYVLSVPNNFEIHHNTDATDSKQLWIILFFSTYSSTIYMRIFGTTQLLLIKKLHTLSLKL